MMTGSIRNASPSRDLRFVVRVATPLIITGLGLGLFFNHRRANEEAQRQFSQKQMYQARKAADHLGTAFQEVRTILSLMLSLGHDAHDRQLLRTMVTSLRDQGGVLAFRRQTQGLQISDESRRPALEALLEQPAIRGADMSPGLVVRGPVRSSLARSGWVVLVSMRQGGDHGGQGDTACVVLDWGGLQRAISRITKLSADSYSWVLDHRGRLVMHPQHQDQLGRSALAITDSCSSCHTSFELHRKMTRGLTGAGRIQVGNASPKLVAFTPFQVGTRRWSLGVTTSASQVLSESLQGQASSFIFFGAIMLAMITSALLLDRESSRRIRIAEEFTAELEREVSQRTEELRELYTRLSALQADHGRLERVTVVGEMASIVAHEIRTPLNALSINAQMISRLLHREGAQDQNRARELLGTLQGEIQRINNLLQDHLLSLVRHRQTRIEPLSLNEQVMDAIRFIEPEATRRGVRLTPHLAPDLDPVPADAARLRQILLNIVLNAIQAMPDGGDVDLTTALEQDWATITVQDNGPGIDVNLLAGEEQQDLRQVFRPFVTTKDDGTGLGLAICARLIRDMGGEITVSSTQGAGACFKITMPRHSSKQAPLPHRQHGRAWQPTQHDRSGRTG